MRTKANTKRGFTLVEVLLVLVILVGLGALAATTIFGSREQANIDETKARMNNIRGAIDRFRLNMERLPEDGEEGLEELMVKPDLGDEAAEDKWQGPYLENRDQLKDAWGEPIEYTIEEDSSSGRERQVVRLSSPGPDREPGTEDDIVVGGADEEEM